MLSEDDCSVSMSIPIVATIQKALQVHSSDTGVKTLKRGLHESNCAIERALSSTAKKFQTPPASTISVERLFSVGGNVLDDKRKKLKAKSVSRLMFSREAMRALKYNY